MDKRIHYLIGLDTETCNGILIDDKLDLTQSLVYDIGWAVTDKRGHIYRTRSFVVKEIFYGMADVMTSAYYADKIPQYKKDIKNGTRSLASLYHIRKILLEDISLYGVKNIFAHNAAFDVRALNNTIRYLTKSRFRWFFPWDVTIWDTLKMAKQVIGTQKSYQIFCAEHGYLTKHKKPRVRLTAQILYRYLTGDENFTESHTGLEDVLIETQILAHCIRQHKKMEKRLYPN